MLKKIQILRLPLYYADDRTTSSASPLTKRKPRNLSLVKRTGLSSRNDVTFPPRTAEDFSLAAKSASTAKTAFLCQHKRSPTSQQPTTCTASCATTKGRSGFLHNKEKKKKSRNQILGRKRTVVISGRGGGRQGQEQPEGEDGAPAAAGRCEGGVECD